MRRHARPGFFALVTLAIVSGIAGCGSDQSQAVIRAGQASGTSSASPTPAPSLSPSSADSTSGQTACTAPAVTVGNYTYIETFGVVDGNTYTQHKWQLGRFNVRDTGTNTHADCNRSRRADADSKRRSPRPDPDRHGNRVLRDLFGAGVLGNEFQSEALYCRGNDGMPHPVFSAKHRRNRRTIADKTYRPSDPYAKFQRVRLPERYRHSLFDRYRKYDESHDYEPHAEFRQRDVFIYR